MLRTIRVEFSDIEDKLIVPFYFAKKIIKEISIHFNTKSVGNISDVPVSGSYISEYAEEGIPYIRVQNVRNSVLNSNKGDLVFVDGSKVKVPDKIRVKYGDIIMSRTTSSPSNFGNNVIVSEAFDNSIISQHVTRLRVKGYNYYYLSAFLNSFYGKLQIVSAGYGSTRLELTHDELKKVIVPEISKEEIAIVGSKIKEALSCEEKAGKLIDDSLKYFYDVLNINETKFNKGEIFLVDYGKLDDTLCPYYYYPLFSDYLNEIKANFKTIKLGEIVKIARGDEVGSENYSVSLKKTSEDIPFIRTSDVINYEIDSYPDYYVVPEIKKLLSQNVEKGDIIFTKDGKIGLVGMITKNDICILSSGIAYLKIKSTCTLSREYIFLCLVSNIGLFQSKQRTVIASTLPHLRPEQLYEFEIPILDSTSQKKITKLVKLAFELKDKRKVLIKDAKKILETEIDKKLKIKFNTFE